MPRRPVIAIPAPLEDARWGPWHETAAVLPLSYVRAVQRAGGMALLLPPDEVLVDEPEEALAHVDALLLAGGADLDPAVYGAARDPRTTQTTPERDRTEIALARAALARDLPLLGICRGMQVLNVARAGTLVQHVPDVVGHEGHRVRPGVFGGHVVRLAAGSLAARAAGETEHDALSHHHQAVDRLGEGLVVTGWSALGDELPEAVEDPSRRFALGVQWHPEADERSRLVGALVETARTRP